MFMLLEALDSSASFDPFGVPTGASGTSVGVGFQGSWSDPGSGEVNAGARWYRPSTGTFTVRDTVAYSGGASIGGNRYTYGVGDPVTFLDPDGRRPILDGPGSDARYQRLYSRKPTGHAPAPKPQPSSGNKSSDANVGFFLLWYAIMTAPSRGHGGGVSSRGHGGSGVSARQASARLRGQAMASKARALNLVRHTPVAPHGIASRGFLEALHRHNVALAKLPAAAVAWARDIHAANERGSHAVRTAAVKANGSAVRNVSTASSANSGGWGQWGRDMVRGGANAAWDDVEGLVSLLAHAGPSGGTSVVGQAYDRFADPAIQEAHTRLESWGGGQKSGAYYGAYATATVGLMFTPVGEGGLGARLANRVRRVSSVDVGAQSGSWWGRQARGVADRVASSCNSFTVGTPVVMGDGMRKAIDMVRVGDQVLAKDPVSGLQGRRRVSALIRHAGKHVLVAVTMTAAVIAGPVGVATASPVGKSTVTVATAGHPFWDATTARYTTADHLTVGHDLIGPDGGLVRITALTTTTKPDVWAYNLTVEGLHTYYAGTTPTLVHNASCGSGMLGEGGTQTPSYTVHNSNPKFRIDVENPAPGVRPGQIHLQTPDGGKYLYDFDSGGFAGMPKWLEKTLMKDDRVDSAIGKGARILGRNP
jgi:RHS repeat-associated protein